MIVYEFPRGELESLQGLRAWAETPGNTWSTGLPPPGDLADRRRLLRCTETTERGTRAVVISVVFTMTRQPFGLCRHASVSVSSASGIANERPSMNAIGLICKALGFEGDFRSWITQEHPESAALTVVEPVERV